MSTVVEKIFKSFFKNNNFLVPLCVVGVGGLGEERERKPASYLAGLTAQRISKSSLANCVKADGVL